MAPGNVLTPEDSVYLDVLESYARVDRPGVVLLYDSTAGPIRTPPDSSGLLAFGAFVDELPRDLVQSFGARAQERVALQDQVLHRHAPTIRPREASEAELLEDTQEHLYRLPSGVQASTLALSRVGFDSARSQALLHVIWVCGPRCGETRLVLLRRGEDGRWQVARSERGWIF